MLNDVVIILLLIITSCDKSSVDEVKSSNDYKNQTKVIPPITGTPLVWGFDDAGVQPPLQVEEKILKDFGFDLVVHHYLPEKSGNEIVLKELSNFYKEHHTQWILNLETANSHQSFIDDKGRDWYNRADGCHYFMFPEEVLEALSTLPHKPGIMYDEAEHMQNSRNSKVGKPYILNADEVQNLADASSAFTEKASRVYEKYKKFGLQVYTEHVFPVQFHTFADAGFIPVSKILKENCIPAYIACALGAAIEYNKPFWLTPDLWHLQRYPGHTPEEYKSALIMAYHMGADGIYTENIGFEQGGQGKGSLILMNKDKTDYQITKWGEITKWFRWEYVPQNPRNYKYNELVPRVAIIRQEDACWGQSNSWLPDQLFGNKLWQSTSITEAWLQIWSLLSNGKISFHSISWHNNFVRKLSYNVIYPLDGVVVFDEKVGGEHLKDVGLIFLTGLGISPVTLNAIKSKVKQGAVCISLPDLAPPGVKQATHNNGVFNDGKGKWVITDSFLSPLAKEYADPFILKENYSRYRFGNTEIQFRPVDGNMNNVEAITAPVNGK